MSHLTRIFAGLRRRGATLLKSPGTTESNVEGYVDERSTLHVAGWLRDTRDPAHRLAYEIAVALPESTRVIAHGVADDLDPALQQLGVGDGRYGFRVRFDPPLTQRERDHLIVRPTPDGQPLTLAPQFQGFVDERSVRHVAGWIRNRSDTADRVAYEVVLMSAQGEHVLASGTADAFNAALAELSVGDARYGYWVRFPEPLSEAERDSVIVRPVGTPAPLALAPELRTTFEPVQGYLDERSVHHVAGWLRNRADPTDRVAYEVVLESGQGERVLASGTADGFNAPLAELAIGDAHYGFWVLFPESLTEAERDSVAVRPVGTRTPLEHAPGLRTAFEPISHVAMDIVNNCNLRCPFCVFDYAETRRTKLMSRDTFDAALRLIPFVTEGNFWLSCLHEATLHPQLLHFIDSVPTQWRNKIMYTTNLAKRMPDAYFAALADSGLHHINVSLESLDPPLYERMRKGARWKIFAANWEKLLVAFGNGSAPPRLRYNIMAYRSNLAEIPELARLLLAERLAWQVEVRYTYDVPYIPDGFRESEFLTAENWTWLADQLGDLPPDRLVLLPPPAAAPIRPSSSDAPTDRAGRTTQTTTLRSVPHPLNIRVDWDGRLVVYGEWPGPDGRREHENFLVTNVNHVRDARHFVASL